MIAKKITDMMMNPIRIPFEETEKSDSNEGFGEAFSDYHNKWDRHPFEIQSDDIVINGEYILCPEAASKPSKVVIVCHGQTVTRAGAVKYAKMFYDMGYNIVLFDERYFGKTTGTCCTLGWKEHEDITAVIRYTKTVFGEDCFLGIHGESLGAGSSLLALKYETPDFMIEDCPFADTGMLIGDLAHKYLRLIEKSLIKRVEKLCDKRYPGYSFKNVKPKDAVAGTNVPICFMHGAQDRLIFCKHSKIMYDSCKNPLREIHLFKDTDHARSVFNYPKEYEKIMRDFVKKVEREKGY